MPDKNLDDLGDFGVQFVVVRMVVLEAGEGKGCDGYAAEVLFRCRLVGEGVRWRDR